jgi:dipeptidyl aminopeptidase/acylaminoacyl peptidase
VALYRTTADGGGVTPVVNEPGRVSGFSRSGTGELAYIFQSAREPAEVVVRPATGPSRQLTHLNRDWLGERVVSLPEPFEFSSFDGTRVEGFLFAPVQRIPGRRYPLIVVLHGGPHDHQGLVFSHRAQVYAGLGYVVAMINYRGSTGYGQKFADGTVGDQNGGEAKDVLAGVDHLLRHFSFIDPDRLGIEGGSYGGQLVNWLITQTPRFKAAISISGISNFLSFAYTIWAHDYVQVEFGGYPWERDIAAFMWQRSALAHVAKARTPTLFIHGEEDQDVSITEAEQMYMGLKEVGVEAMLLRYPREGHGLNEPGHVADALDRSLKWYARFLKPNPTGADDQ